jgi:hypothetical protein
MKPESQFWSTLKKHLRHEDFHVHFQRVENLAGGGMPDVYVQFRGITRFIELKVCEYETGDPDKMLRDTQRIWMIDHCRAGGLPFVLVKYKKSTVLYYVSENRRALVFTHVITLKGRIDWSIFRNNLYGLNGIYQKRLSR